MEIGSKALVADSKETIACALLSVALLLGLGLNYVAGIWWADPIAALVVVFFLFREGWEGLISFPSCNVINTNNDKVEPVCPMLNDESRVPGHPSCLQVY
jgi:Co/Zn/Cd efflux system component